jgi:hypothetical protein
LKILLWFYLNLTATFTGTWKQRRFEVNA